MSVPETFESDTSGLRIKIVGVGGAGNNATDRLKLNNLSSVHLININTDKKTLSASPVSEKLMIGKGVTSGLSCGGELELGQKAAESDQEAISQKIAGADLVFLLAGLGGGTGSGASPVVAKCAQEQGALVVAFVTLPFSREGARRMKQAEDALRQLREHCNAVIPLPNDVLLQEIDEDATLLDAFTIADRWIERGVCAIWSMIFQSGLMNVDFASLRNALSLGGGKTLFGMGSGEGEDFVAKAIRDLELCPLLHLPENRYVRKTDSLIVSITGGPDLSMSKVTEIMDFVTERFGSKENNVFGAVVDESMTGKVEITVIGSTLVDNIKRRYGPVPAASSPPRSSGRMEVGSGTNAASTTTGAPMVTTSKGDLFDDQTEGFRMPENQMAVASSSKVSYSKSKNPSKAGQEEFDFPRIEESRGHFEKTETNLYEGADLDVPTYLRRGVKIALA